MTAVFLQNYCLKLQNILKTLVPCTLINTDLKPNTFKSIDLHYYMFRHVCDILRKSIYQIETWWYVVDYTGNNR